MTDKLVTIATFGEPFQAETSRVKLDDMGIECFLTEDATHTLYGYAAGTIRLQVRESDADKALEALKVDSRNRCTQCGQEIEDSAKYCPNCEAETGGYRQEEARAWICPKCNEQIEAQFDDCWNCATGKIESPIIGPRGPEPPDIPTHLTRAIVVTLFFCWPLGIPAIYYAAKTRSKLQNGDYYAAEKVSHKAKTWCWIALITGLVIIVLNLCLLVVSSVMR